MRKFIFPLLLFLGFGPSMNAFAIKLVSPCVDALLGVEFPLPLQVSHLKLARKMGFETFPREDSAMREVLNEIVTTLPIKQIKDDLSMMGCEVVSMPLPGGLRGEKKLRARLAEAYLITLNYKDGAKVFLNRVQKRSRGVLSKQRLVAALPQLLMDLSRIKIPNAQNWASHLSFAEMYYRPGADENSLIVEGTFSFPPRLTDLEKVSLLRVHLRRLPQVQVQHLRIIPWELPVSYPAAVHYRAVVVME